jgi:peptide/nickel transport system ATP-binding protein
VTDTTTASADATDSADSAGSTGSAGSGSSAPNPGPGVADTPVVDDEIVLTADQLVVEFRSGRQTVQAVSGVSFSVRNGETLGLVGESGCGKSTTGRALVQVQPPTSGRVFYKNQDLTQLKPRELRRVRTKIQMIFQDPISSLNPRRRVRDIVAEPLNIWGRGTKKERAAKVREMLLAVGIDPDTAGDRRPQEFSGGQCQRISIARALMAEPDLLICDEPVSALDVSVQAQILNLLADLKEKFGLTMVFIAHDLAVVKNVSDRVAVMYLGKLVEIAQSDELYRSAAHPYTEALLASIPEPDPDHTSDHKALTGELPSPLNPPSGCRFRTRCPYAQDLCAEQEPPLREIAPGHQVACHFPLIEGVDGIAGPVAAVAVVAPSNGGAAGPPSSDPPNPTPPISTPPTPPVPPTPVAPASGPPPSAPPVTSRPQGEPANGATAAVTDGDGDAQNDGGSKKKKKKK